MNKQIEALKLALEALETNNKAWKSLADSGDAGWWDAEEQSFYELSVKAITAIREALAHPPIAWLPPDPPPECQTEAEKTAFAFGWFKALEQKRKADSALDRMAENARELGLDYEPDVVLPGGGHVPAVPVAVYGYCPECGGAGVLRERRPNGDDKCTNGHKYPSAKALAEPPCKTGSQCTSKCQQCEQPARAAIARAEGTCKAEGEQA